MEIRLLRSFLAIAEEGSITAATKRLHITQPALSRQLVQLENDLGCRLFERGKRSMTLTEDGLLLMRRAKEILALVSLTESEIASRSSLVEGTISIGTGELSAMKTLARLIAGFREKQPNVKFSILTGVADQVSERIDRGLLDMGLFLEPVNKETYDYLRMPDCETWVACMRPDNPLAEKDYVTADDLKGQSLILPNRPTIQSELAHWFGKGKHRLQSDYSVNLGDMSSVMVEENLGVMLCVKGSTMNWDPKRFTLRPLSPEMKSGTLLAWKSDVTQTAALSLFIDHVKEELDSMAREIDS